MELIKRAVREKNIGFLCHYFFGTTLTKGQTEIARAIAFPDNNRNVISCCTRYGKSYVAARAILVNISLHSNKRNLIIAPTIEQANIIRNYISEAIMTSSFFSELVDINATGIDRLKTEVSKKRITFTNGASLMILSAEGEGKRLMGHGADGLLIIDESCLIDYEVYRAKIHRMLGDDPESVLIEIGNPWHTDGQMHVHWLDPNFKKIHIDDKQALEEKRITPEFLAEQKASLTDIEYRVLYQSLFPDDSQATDRYFNRDAILSAIEDYPMIENIYG